jgi:hypothetical protein
MTEDNRKSLIRSLLLLELNNVFTKTYHHFAEHGTEADRRYLQNLIEVLKESLNAEPREVEIQPE